MFELLPPLDCKLSQSYALFEDLVKVQREDIDDWLRGALLLMEGQQLRSLHLHMYDGILLLLGWMRMVPPEHSYVFFSRLEMLHSSHSS